MTDKSAWRVLSRPSWVTKDIWGDFGNQLDEGNGSYVHMYARQQKQPMESDRHFTGGLCGSWFDTLFTDVPSKVTCGKCRRTLGGEVK